MSEYLAARGAVVRQPGGPVNIEAVEVRRAEGAEVTVRVDACGLCHSDLHYIDGTSGGEFPYLLGHEVSGTIAYVGDQVTDVLVGDKIVVALLNPCGECSQCRRGRRTGCLNKTAKQRAPRLLDGTPLTPVLGAGGLATYITVPRRHVVVLKTDMSAPLASLLGCGVPTGFGAAVNTGGIRAGDRVAVIGAGGVGLAAIAGARFAEAAEVHAVDLVPSRLATAREFGATEVHDARGLGISDYFDVVIDAVGGARTLSTSVTLARLGGRIVMVGAPTTTEVGQLAMREFFLKGLQLVVSQWGDCDPERDLQLLQEQVTDGTFPLHRYLTESVPLEEAAGAYERLRAGEVLRSSVLVSTP